MELCKYLQQKYGLPPCDYYHTPECKSKNSKVTRTSDGLFCHHIFEDRYGNVGEKHLAARHPFEAQKKENLAYCNYIEHLILHLKINVNAASYFEYPTEVKKFFNSLGFFWIAEDINYLYKNEGSDQKWKNNCYKAIENDFKDYVDILQGALYFIDASYVGSKKIKITPGARFFTDVVCSDVSADRSLKRGQQYGYIRVEEEVVEISEERNEALARITDKDQVNDSIMMGIMFSSGENLRPFKEWGNSGYIKYDLSKLRSSWDYDEVINHFKNIICSFPEGGVWKELAEMLSEPFGENEKAIASWLKEGLD